MILLAMSHGCERLVVDLLIFFSVHIYRGVCTRKVGDRDPVHSST